LERFRRKARAAATLSHRGIFPVYDVGVLSGIPFLTMAYVEGQTLAALLKAGPPPAPRQAAALVRKLAAALAEAHLRGVIHPDLKPPNVMIAEGGGSRHPHGGPHPCRGQRPLCPVMTRSSCGWEKRGGSGWPSQGV
jgi:serine/threonine protein kinase